MLTRLSAENNKLRGRLYKEDESFFLLSDFEIDRARIVESKAFRRLEHKTQVFTSGKTDHDRSRLTHSIEVAHTARIITKSLGLSSNLAENLALAHDFGHAPFGHAGEDALKEMMNKFGLDFDHNAHSLKIITKLEKRAIYHEGLNLTWEFLEGLVKHNGPIDNPCLIIENYNNKHNLELSKYPSVEAQIAAISDDIAYNNHDIDDGFRSGILSVNQLREVEILNSLIEKIYSDHNNIEDRKLVSALVQKLKHMMIMDVIDNIRKEVKSYGITTSTEIRELNKNIASFSKEMEKHHQQIKSFLMKNLYSHYTIRKVSNLGKRCIKSLFEIFMNDFACLPSSWQNNICLLNDREKAIVVCDFIAGMSDRYALEEYRSFH